MHAQSRHITGQYSDRAIVSRSSVKALANAQFMRVTRMCHLCFSMYTGDPSPLCSSIAIELHEACTDFLSIAIERLPA